MDNLFYFLMPPLLLVMEVGYIQLARRYQVWDLPNTRTLHETPTIRGGGVVFYLAILFYFIWSDQRDLYFMAGLTLVSVVGLADDFRSLNSGFRFLLQVLSFAVLFLGLDYPVDVLLVILFIGSVAGLNAFNFMDGINGLTAGYGLVMLGTLAYINMALIRFIDPAFLITGMFGVGVFAWFNFRKKAVCFAGDVGSLSLGFIIIYLIIKLILVSGNYVYVFFLSVYGMDTLLTVIHRLMLKENIFSPHRHHLFQMIVFKKGVGHLPMAMIYMAVQVLCNVTIISLSSFGSSIQWMTGLTLCATMALVYVLVKQRLSVISVSG